MKNKRVVPTIFRAICLPFLVSRLLLLVTGYVSTLMLPFSYNPDAIIANRGWLFSPLRSIDMWARWDSGWYLGIITEGYRVVENVYTESNLAFFPLYPLLIKLIVNLLPSESITSELILAIGILLSNMFLLVSLVVVYKISMKVFASKAVAERSVWLLCLFPTSFFLSSFYTESTFLMLSTLSIWFAISKKWKSAVFFAILLGMTRLVGIFIIFPLAMLVLQEHTLYEKKTKWLLGIIALVPTGFILFVLYLYRLTGDLLATFKVQSAWGKQLSEPLQSLFFPTGSWIYLTPFDQIMVISSFATATRMMFEKHIRFLNPLGLYSMLILIPVLFTGTLDSYSRFVLMAFPIFIYWAWLLDDHKYIDYILRISFICMQLCYFGLFSQFYWVG